MRHFETPFWVMINRLTVWRVYKFQVFTSESLSLFRDIVSKFHIFVDNYSNISEYFKYIVSYCCLWKNETWRERLLNNERRVLLANTKFPTKLANFSPYFTALQRSYKTTVNHENLNIFRPHVPAGMTSLSDLAVSKLFAYLFKRAPQWILMKSFFVVIY